MVAEHTLEFEGPTVLSTTAAGPEPAAVSLRCGSELPEGTEVCVTVGDYRVHSEGVELGRFAVEGCSGGDIEVVEGSPATDFSERNDRRLGAQAFRLATVRATDRIEPGARIQFDLGIGTGGHAGNDLALDVRVRSPGDDSWERVGQRIVVRSEAGPPAGFEVRPQIDGRRLHATVFAVDSLLNPTEHPEPIRVEATEGAIEGLPTTVSLSDGPSTVEGRMVEGPVRLRASDDRGESATSPLLHTGATPAPTDGPLFGALHFHSRFSGDGGRAMADAYRYARDVLNLDFVAATDHTPTGNWDEVVAINERFDDPGTFATIPAWEWSTSEGHANLYLRSTDSTATPDVTGEEASYPYHVDWPGDAIMAPHHTNQRSNALNDEGEHYWREYDWSVENDRMGFVEVHQTRGNFEADDVDPDWRIKHGAIGASIQDALDRGYRLGFVGGTDNHTGYPTRGALGGYPDIVGRYVGLTGVYAEDRTREAVWDALEGRRSYATTGVPIRVGFAVNGEPLGGVAAVDGGASADPAFDAELHGTAPIERVEVIADAETVWSADPGERDVRIENEALPGPGDPGYYYLRLRQADDHMAWASPVWLGE